MTHRPPMMSRSCLVLALCALVPGLLMAQSGARAPHSADTLADALEARYRTVRDFSADFVHTYRGGALKKTVTERGTALIKKPGRMRWTYTTPEKKTFVSDGQRLYSYVPEDRQVVVTSVPSDDRAPAPTLFLAGKGNLSRDFTVAPADGVPGTRAVRLTPKRPEADYESFVLYVEPTTLQIRGLATTDHQGGQSTVLFSNVKENQGVADTAFAFRVPRGVDVVTDDTPLR